MATANSNTCPRCSSKDDSECWRVGCSGLRGPGDAECLACGSERDDNQLLHKDPKTLRCLLPALLPESASTENDNTAGRWPAVTCEP